MPPTGVGCGGGDVVLAVEGRRVNEPNELQSSIARHRPGDQVAVEVWRQGKTQELLIELLGRDDPAVSSWISELDAERQAPEPDLEADPLPTRPNLEVFQLGGWGFGIREMTDRERNGFDVEQGVYLVYIEKGTLAEAAGIPRDVIILSVDEEPVASVQDVVRLLGLATGSSDAVLLRIKQRDGLDAFYELDVPAQ